MDSRRACIERTSKIDQSVAVACPIHVEIDVEIDGEGNANIWAEPEQDRE